MGGGPRYAEAAEEEGTARSQVDNQKTAVVSFECSKVQIRAEKDQQSRYYGYCAEHRRYGKMPACTLSLKNFRQQVDVDTARSATEERQAYGQKGEVIVHR